MTPSEGSLQIRTTEPSDWPALARMYETFEPKRASFGLPPLHHPEDWLTEIRTTGHNLVVICKGEIVGHGLVCRGGRGDFATSDAEFALFIHQDFRRMGLGRKLLEALIAEARRLGVRFLWGVEEADNQALFHLTEALGFGGGRHEGMVYLRLAPEGVVQSTGAASREEAKVIRCSYVDCDFEASGRTLKEVLERCADHALSAHGMDDIPFELAARIVAAFRKEAKKAA